MYLKQVFQIYNNVFMNGIITKQETVLEIIFGMRCSIHSLDEVLSKNKIK